MNTIFDYRLIIKKLNTKKTKKIIKKSLNFSLINKNGLF